MIELDVSGFRATLSAVEQHQLPYAAKTAVNNLAIAFQEYQRDSDRQVFTLNRSEWVDRSIKITQFATKQNPTAIVGIHPPGGDAKSDILGKFEEGGVKESQGSHGFIAIPAFMNHTRGGLVPTALRPKNLNLTGPRGRMLGKGSQRTLIVELQNGDRAIFQRIGTRSRDRRRGYGHGRDPNLVLLYVLKRSVPIPAELHFHDNAIKVTEERWESIFGDAWRQALATAR